ncbi:MAG: TldD/PmbA family protein [Armatimonadetes bacterium]|nr:TldD/PmbA family protein [Armatimonadota bacterium]
MTSDPNDIERTIRAAIANVAGAHLFFEERVDVRMILASSGLREIVETRTRGAAISRGRSVHVTDPSFLDPSCGAMTSPILWVPRLEGPIVEAAARASAGRRHPLWSAKLVSFHQDVWVGPPGKDAVHDVREGCRLELRVQVGGERPGFAVQDLVLRADDSPSLAEAFSRGFDRAEARASSFPAPGPGSMSAVLAPGVAGIVAHELIGHALEGDVVARGSTWISAETFPATGAPVTVIDDPRRGRGAWRIDDEGVAAGEITLIARGRPAGMLLDRASAVALGAVPTGHGRRSSYLETVRPRMGCTFIAAGVDAPEDILRSTRTGVFIRRLAGGHTEPLTGRASVIVSDADRIVDGRLAEPLEPFVIELDGVESWSSIDRVGHDLAFDTCVGSCVRDGQPMAVSVGAPTIRIGVVRVRS